MAKRFGNSVISATLAAAMVFGAFPLQQAQAAGLFGGPLALRDGGNPSVTDVQYRRGGQRHAHRGGGNGGLAVGALIGAAIIGSAIIANSRSERRYYAPEENYYYESGYAPQPYYAAPEAYYDEEPVYQPRYPRPVYVPAFGPGYRGSNIDHSRHDAYRGYHSGGPGHHQQHRGIAKYRLHGQNPDGNTSR